MNCKDLIFGDGECRKIILKDIKSSVICCYTIFKLPFNYKLPISTADENKPASLIFNMFKHLKENYVFSSFDLI